MTYTRMKKRIQVSLNPVLVEWARQMMKARGYDSLSEFLESLIRDEQDRRSAGPADTPSDAWPSIPDRLNDLAASPRKRRGRK